MTQSSAPREALLNEATHLIMGDRNNQYGPPTQDFEKIAKMLSIQGFRVVDAGGFPRDLKSHHVATMMITLKLSRLSWDHQKFDSWIDVAGYAACGWECVETGEDSLY